MDLCSAVRALECLSDWVQVRWLSVGSLWFRMIIESLKAPWTLGTVGIYRDYTELGPAP